MRRLISATLPFLAALAAGCVSSSPSLLGVQGGGLIKIPPTSTASTQPSTANAPRAHVDSGRYGYTRADVAFLQGMIPHHAQAVLMSSWAASHGARSDVRILCERIVVAQRDEIASMREWLRDRRETVPDSTATKMRMTMGGVEHEMLMPGMLSDAEMAALDSARGPAWDRLFLQGMIRHHQGALRMVEELRGTNGAAQDDFIFAFSSDVYADQETEIARMRQMLAVTPGG